MLDESIRAELASLSKIYEATVKLEYQLKYDKGIAPQQFVNDIWRISTSEHIVGWAGFFTDPAKGTSGRMTNAGSPNYFAKTPREALDQFKAKTIDAPNGFLFSSHAFGLFVESEDDGRPTILRHFKGDQLLQRFEYDREKIRTIMTEIDPVGAKETFKSSTPSPA